MKTSSDVKQNNYQDYLKRGQENGLAKKLQSKTNRNLAPDSKVDVSEKAKKLADSAKKAATSPNIATQAATSVVTNTAMSGLKALVTGGDDSEETAKAAELAAKKEQDETKEKEEELQAKREEMQAKRAATVRNKTKNKGTLKKPAMIFITGFESFSTSTDYGGLRDMAEAIPGARVYSWDQKDEIHEEIAKRALGQPVVLVGHSFGGDTAVEVVNELNTLDKGFRTVDLLVTIDSVGSNNDIIPQNVTENLNYFGEDSWLLNDQPNVARNIEMTKVRNELRSEGHRELDNSSEIQFQVMKHIQKIV